MRKRTIQKSQDLVVMDVSDTVPCSRQNLFISITGPFFLQMKIYFDTNLNGEIEFKYGFHLGENNSLSCFLDIKH